MRRYATAAARRSLSLIAVIAAAGAFFACSKAQGANKSGRDDAAKRINVEPVRKEDVRRAVDIVGTLAAEDQVTISSQSDGAVSRILADLGDRVRAGQVLVELDREKLDYNLEQQKAALVRALAKYGAASTSELPPIERTPDVQKAAAELGQAKQAYDRASELHRRELIPRQTLDDADAGLRSKQAQYDSALQNAKNLRADIDAANAVLKLAERQVRDASIRSPFDGLVQKRLVSLGEFVKNQTPVMMVVRVDPLKVVAEIPEKMVPWIEVGQPLDVRVDAYPADVFHGKVSRISPTVNTQTRAFPFEALVPNSKGTLKPGTFARVHLATARIEPVVTIPYGAMQYRYGINRAYVVAGDRLSMRELKLGDRLGDRMEILDGVRPGDLVALTDVDVLVDGQKVAINSRNTE
jgi:multidrug efflux pump subunit AcrA (membrane-fusion protein)